MEERRPRQGEIYQHFKKKRYQIVAVAVHSETKEELVIYKALYGDGKTYARPLEMFTGEVNHQKYPDVQQKYRFEKVELQNATEDIEQQEERANPRLLAFLDADTNEARYRILEEMNEEITDRLINDFAAALDVVIPDGELEDRYMQLLQCLGTMCRYETTRLR